MANIVILSSSVRTGRNSQRVALFFKNFITEKQLGNPSIVDLSAYDFPLFHERLRNLENPSTEILDFAEKIKAADGVIIVTPEYNGGVPASLKNVVDLLYAEWNYKPVAIATVSSTPFGGTQVLMSLQFTLWKMHAWTVPQAFSVPLVTSAYDEMGNATNPAISEKNATPFVNALVWAIEAKKRMAGE